MIMYSDDILSRISRVEAVTLDYSVCFLVHVTLKNGKKSQPAYGMIPFTKMQLP